MTQDTFCNTRFGVGMVAIYDGGEYDIVSVDFKEMLIGIDEKISGEEEDDVSWKRCENLEIKA